MQPEAPAPPAKEPERSSAPKAASEAEARGQRLRAASQAANARAAELIAGSRALLEQLAVLELQERAVWTRAVDWAAGWPYH